MGCYMRRLEVVFVFALYYTQPKGPCLRSVFESVGEFRAEKVGVKTSVLGVTCF